MSQMATICIIVLLVWCAFCLESITQNTILTRLVIERMEKGATHE